MTSRDTGRKRDRLIVGVKTIFRRSSSGSRRTKCITSTAPSSSLPLRPPTEALSESPSQTPSQSFDKSETHNKPGKGRWEKALDNLSEEDRAIVLRSSLNSKLSSLRELHTLVEIRRVDCQSRGLKYKFGGHEIVLRDLTEKIIVWINKFKEIGDIAVNFDPVHTALPWAGVRFLIQIAVGESQQMGALLVGAEKVASLIDRCSVYEALYLRAEGTEQFEKNLERALLALYMAILRFLAVANRLYESSTKRVVYGLLSPDEVVGFVNNCRSLETELDIEVGNCERSHRKTAHTQLEDNGRQLKQLVESLQEPILRIDHKLSNDRSESERLKILNYLSSIPYEANHYVACDGRTKDTGGWLLKHELFSQWRSSKSSNILWLYGIPGAGKTKLVSTVVDHLLESFDSHQNRESLAYFYCNRNEVDRQDPRLVLSSFLRQLSILQDGHALHRSVVELYERKKLTGFMSGSLTIEETRAALIRLSEDLPHITLVLDALDECDESTRAQLMDTLDTLVHQSSNLIKIFISSRPDQDIKHHFKRRLNLAILATNNLDDIASFVNDRISNSPPYWREKISPDLKTRICDTLVANSEGMFQWVALQIDQLLRLPPRKGDIRKRLGRLPKTLDNAYQEIYKRIQSQEGSNPEIANRAFQWVMCSEWPLSPEELVAAACQDPETDGTDPVDIDIDTVLAACHNLLTVDHELEVCRFSHLSVQEYLETHHWNNSEANGLVAKACLCILNDPDQGPSVASRSNSSEDTSTRDSEDGPRIYVKEISSRFNTTNIDQCLASSIGTLFYYVVDNWFLHVQRHGEEIVDKRCTDLLKNFLGSMNKSGSAYRKWHEAACGGSMLTRIHEQLLPCSQASLAICRLGFHRILSDWWTPDSNTLCFVDINQCNDQGESLLQLACAAEVNSLPIVQELLRMGIEANAEVNTASKHCCNAKYLTPLQVASAKGHEEVVSLLLKHGADVNIQPDTSNKLMFSEKMRSTLEYSSALEAASARGHLETVRLLLKNGADANKQFMVWQDGIEERYIDIGYTSALEAAVDNRHLEIVRLLLGNGADVNKHFILQDNGNSNNRIRDLTGFQCGPVTVLHIASSLGALAEVQLLLEYGADTFPLGEHYSTSALYWACYGGNEDVVRLLLPRTPDPKTPSPAVQEAVLIDDAAKELVHSVVNTALGRAASEGNITTVEPLLTEGAKANVQDKYYAAALVAVVSSSGCMGIVKLLLNHGANPNLRYVEGRGLNPTALQVASSSGLTELVKLLLENGADVNADGARYGTALQAASYTQSIEIVKLLLANGADVNADVNADAGGAWYGTALQAASHAKSIEIVKLLLANGADVNANESSHGTALQAASHAESIEIVKLLLANGADVNANQSSHATALEAASCVESIEIVKLLLANGADINANGSSLGTALQAASLAKSVKIVKLLLANGADSNANGGFYGTALQTASHAESIEIVKLLLANGADVNANGGYHGTALQAASRAQSIEIVKLLLASGADVNSNGGQYGTALEAAAFGPQGKKNKALIPLLLDHGARWPPEKSQKNDNQHSSYDEYSTEEDEEWSESEDITQGNTRLSED